MPQFKVGDLVQNIQPNSIWGTKVYTVKKVLDDGGILFLGEYTLKYCNSVDWKQCNYMKSLLYKAITEYTE